MKHAFWAASNAGARGLIPFGSWMLPFEFGSGKFEMPWARMHSDTLRPEAWRLEPEEEDDPHAASATAQPSAASVRLPLRVRIGPF